MEDQIRKIMEGAERLAYVVIQAVGDLDDYEQTRGPLLFLHGVGGLLCCLGKAANEGKIDADEWGGHLEGIGFMVGDCGPGAAQATWTEKPMQIAHTNTPASRAG